jgi:hypothetical protein
MLKGQKMEQPRTKSGTSAIKQEISGRKILKKG